MTSGPGKNGNGNGNATLVKVLYVSLAALGTLSLALGMLAITNKIEHDRRMADTVDGNKEAIAVNQSAILLNQQAIEFNLSQLNEKTGALEDAIDNLAEAFRDYKVGEARVERK